MELVSHTASSLPFEGTDFLPERGGFSEPEPNYVVAEKSKFFSYGP